MIIELSVKNCFVFNNQIVFLLDPTNKTTAIYGPNNADKTCLIKCIQAMKEILLNQRIEIKLNLFSNDSVCELGITFEYEKNILSFCLLFWTLGVIFFFENALIDFRVIIGIILLKVAIPLDVVSIYKSCGRMRDGKRSCLMIVDNRQKNLPVYNIKF